MPLIYEDSNFSEAEELEKTCARGSSSTFNQTTIQQALRAQP